jgi:hypothetical protein
MSVDPLKNKFAWYTPYQFAGNIPIAMLDPDGMEEVSASIGYDPNTTTGSVRYPVLMPSQWKQMDRSTKSQKIRAYLKRFRRLNRYAKISLAMPAMNILLNRMFSMVLRP